MGIRGLTTFIARNPHKYLEYYELHDTYLVIDGNNIASHLYKWHCTRNDCFGGDYDKYARVIYIFFKLLEDCNITPLVVFDGAYEDKKMKTVYSRMRNRVRYAKTLNSVTQASGTLFPIFLRDVFVDIILKLKLKTFRCDFEADQEMACLAASLNCPILSYDSDFYVFDVLYVPFSSFEMNTHKVKGSSPPKYCIGCHLYKIENFVKLYGGLKRENIPLMATLLGNDYIKSSVFAAFYSQLKLFKHKHTKSDQQNRIVGIIKWLQNETYESALMKVLSRLKTPRRKRVAQQIQFVSEGYACKNSKLISYFDIPVTLNKNEDSALNFSSITDKCLEGTNVESEDNCADDDTCSDTSESASETSLSSAESIESVKPDILPAWFMKKFRKCEYPSAFMDIFIRNTYFCPPQIEDYSNVCSHHISAVILSAINKILSSGTCTSSVYLARNESGNIQKYTMPPYEKEVPNLSQLENIAPAYAKTVLLEILELNAKDVDFVNEIPELWRLYILGVIYWIRKAKSQVAYCHVYSVILCMLIITKVDTEIGFCRSNSKFMTKFDNIIKNIPKSEAAPLEKKENSLIASLNNITYNECLLCMKGLIGYFQMDQKMTTRLKLFDIHVVDCFAQFQSCLMHIKYLNILLNKPYANFIISDFYDGTFLFNMSINLMKRTNIDNYMEILLKDSPNILNCLKWLVGRLIASSSENIAVNNVKRRRKKKKCNKISNDVVSSDSAEDTKDVVPNEDVFDVNNRFSLLKLVE